MRQTTKLHRWFLRFDRAFSDKIWRQILILIGFVFVALAIGLIICSFLSFGKEGSKLSSYEWALYLLIDGNALSNLYTDTYPAEGRLWVIVFAVLGSLLGVILFGGMLISVLSNMLERRIENYRKGKNAYVIAGHHVILGYDEIVPSIIKQICTKNKDAYVLLQSSLPSEEIAERIHSSIAQDCEKRVIIKNGHRTSTKDLSELKLNKACNIYIVGDRTKPFHDAMNIDCMEKTHDILKKNKKNGLPKIITTVFEDPDTYAVLQVTDLFENIRKLEIEFIPYNFYTDWAKQMFADADGQRFPFVDGEGISANSKQHVHLVIVGTSNFGVTLGLEAAKMLHFPNFDGHNNRTEITFIDLNADKELKLFMTRSRYFFEVQDHIYGKFVKNDDKKGKIIYIEETRPATAFSGKNANFLDVKFRFIKGDIYSREVQQLITQWACDDTQILSLFFAMRDSRHNMSIAMNLTDKVYERGTRIFVRQNTSSIFLDKVRKLSQTVKEKKTINDKGVMESQQTKGRYANIYPFGMTDITYDTNEQILCIAECINHIYEVYKKLNYSRIPTEQEILEATRDEMHQEWKKLPVAFQWSNIYCAYNIVYRIRTIKALRGNPTDNILDISDKETEELAPIEHNRWNVEKLLLGYRKPLKDEDSYYAKKVTNDEAISKTIKVANKEIFIHSDIRPYMNLNEIQDIDKAIIRFIPWFIKMSNE